MDYTQVGNNDQFAVSKSPSQIWHICQLAGAQCSSQVEDIASLKYSSVQVISGTTELALFELFKSCWGQ
jgi:hypothetical protein